MGNWWLGISVVQWLFQFLKVSFADLLNIFKPPSSPFRILKCPDKPTVSLWIVTSPPTVLPGNTITITNHQCAPTYIFSQLYFHLKEVFFIFLSNVLPVVVRPTGGALLPLNNPGHLEKNAVNLILVKTWPPPPASPPPLISSLSLLLSLQEGDNCHFSALPPAPAAAHLLESEEEGRRQREAERPHPRSPTTSSSTFLPSSSLSSTPSSVSAPVPFLDPSQLRQLQYFQTLGTRSVADPLDSTVVLALHLINCRRTLWFEVHFDLPSFIFNLVSGWNKQTWQGHATVFWYRLFVHASINLGLLRQ